jgi:hypothetical protein
VKSKSFLPIIEILIMILFFSICSAVCLGTFSLSSEISDHSEILDVASIKAQNTAEVLKSTKGDLERSSSLLGGYVDNDRLLISFSKDGQVIDDPIEGGKRADGFELVVTRLECSEKLLEGANISVLQGEEIIYELTVHWQKGGSYEE